MVCSMFDRWHILSHHIRFHSRRRKSRTPEGHFGEGRERRARRVNFRTPSLSELSGLMDSIFLPAFRSLPDFFNAIWCSPARMWKCFCASCIFKPAINVNCSESAKLSLRLGAVRCVQ
jgi:hypothetical protein